MEKILIRQATVVDGTGRPVFKADVVLADEWIEQIGSVSPHSDVFRQVIEADGLTLTPGFMDMHSHSDLMQLVQPEASAKIRQGITTELLGQDGLGTAPVLPKDRASYRQHVAGLLGDLAVSWQWPHFRDYLKELETRKTATNLAVLVSHGPVRLAVMGMAERKATAKEIAAMCQITDEAFQDGAFGLSTGLIYPPCVFSDQEELIELTKVTAKAHGIFVVHVRNERGQVKESIQEIFDIAAKTGVKPHISHLKVIGQENWGTAHELLALFDEARARQIPAAFDQYPYPAGSTMLSILIPPYAHAGGAEALLSRLADSEMRQKLAHEMAEGLAGWENICTAAGWDRILVTGIVSGKNKKWEGQSLAKIAAECGISPQEVVFDLLIQENLQVSMVNFSLSPEDVARIIQHSAGMLGTDGLLLGKPHPRAYGSTARILQKYVKEEGLLTLEEAVARMTLRPAQQLGLADRGMICPGNIADLNLINLAEVAEKSTYTDPCQHPTGFEYVFVQGKAALAKGEETAVLSGKVLRKS